MYNGDRFAALPCETTERTFRSRGGFPVLAPLFDENPLHILTVTEVTRDVKDLLEDTFASVWVEGEISNWRVVQSGHAYFTLKDTQSQLRTVMFRSALRQLPFEPEAGMQVVAHGRLTVYEPRGDYQLLAERLEPQGVGALQMAFEQLKERLFQEGLFDETRKRPLPLVPQRIGIVTSSTGAAIRDIIHVVHRRRANVHLYLYPAHVQGKEAVPDLVRGIAALNAWRPKLDVMIVGRGDTTHQVRHGLFALHMGWVEIEMHVRPTPMHDVNDVADGSSGR